MDGVIPELSLFIGGGGYPGCVQPPGQPKLDYLSSQTAEIMESVMVATCGWADHDTVSITVRSPQGGLWREMQAVKPVPGAYNDIDILFQPPVDSPPGKYLFTFSTAAASVSATVTFTQPSGPHLYSLSDNPFQPVELPAGSHRLAFIDFSPQEQVRLMAYPNGSFSGWKDFTMGTDGRLVVDIPENPQNGNAQIFYYAYGKISGGIPIYRLSPEGGKLDESGFGTVYCPGAKPSRLHLGMPARVTRTDGSDLRVHLQPGFKTSVIGHIPEGTVINNVSGNQCQDETYWWQIDLAGTNTPGWIAESQNGVYMLEPVQ